MKSRGKTGSSTVEFPMVLFFFLFVGLFPLIDLASIFLGSSTIASAARVAALKAARAQTYTTNTSATQLSAVNTATSIAAGFSGGNVNIPASGVTISALQVPVAGGAPQQITPGAAFSVDTSTYTYQIQVTVTGTVTPIVLLGSNIFGNVQGLTIPLTVTTSSTASLENPDALNG